MVPVDQRPPACALRLVLLDRHFCTKGAPLGPRRRPHRSAEAAGRGRYRDRAEGRRVSELSRKQGVRVKEPVLVGPDRAFHAPHDNQKKSTSIGRVHDKPRQVPTTRVLPKPRGGQQYRLEN